MVLKQDINRFQCQGYRLFLQYSYQLEPGSRHIDTNQHQMYSFQGRCSIAFMFDCSAVHSRINDTVLLPNHNSLVIYMSYIYGQLDSIMVCPQGIHTQWFLCYKLCLQGKWKYIFFQLHSVLYLLDKPYIAFFSCHNEFHLGKSCMHCL